MYSQPVLLACAIPCLPPASNRTTGLAESKSQMSWWTCWKYHFMCPVFRSSATIDAVYRFLPGRSPPNQSEPALPVEK